MRLTTRRIARALSRNTATTAPGEPDPRLRGRTYAVPFEHVWQCALALADGGLRGWKLIEADDYHGVIRAEARTLLLRYVDDVEVRITLDENGQTRVDLGSRSRKGVFDLGTNARRIARFCRKLDDRLKRLRGTPPATL